MKVLVSGGAGFIGSHVTEELLKHNYTVVVVDNLSTGLTGHIPKNIKFYHYDLNDPKMELVFEKEQPDMIIHLAAQASVTISMNDPYLDFLTNAAGTLRLLVLAKKYKVRKLLFSSTAAVYGEPSYLPVDEKHPANPTSYYAQSKFSAENYISLYNTLNDLNCCVLRFANVYGPRQNPAGEAGVMSIFINKLLAKEQVTIYDGGQTRDFIYVKDVAAACRLAIESECKGVFNISSGRETTINDVYRLISNVLNVKGSPIYKSLRLGEIERSVLANDQAKLKLNWSPRYSLNEGLKETINDFTNKTIHAVGS